MSLVQIRPMVGVTSGAQYGSPFEMGLANAVVATGLILGIGSGATLLTLQCEASLDGGASWFPVGSPASGSATVGAQVLVDGWFLAGLGRVKATSTGGAVKFLLLVNTYTR